MKKNIFHLAAILFVVSTITSCSKSKSPNPAPVANFSYTGAGLAPATVTFTNSSTNAFSYSWDFGDNGTSTDRNPSHKYTKGGVYTVKLTVTGAGGSASTTKTVNIQAPTSVKITHVSITGMSFTNSSGGGWDTNGTGPDVYYTITDANDVTLFTAATYYTDVTSIPLLGLNWNLNPTYLISNLNATYKIKIWDEDSPLLTNDFIGGYSFSFLSYTTIGYPASVSFGASNTLKISLDLQWQ